MKPDEKYPPAVSRSVIRRLPRYHRYLRTLLSHGQERIRSRELARLMRVNASQIRQDLNCFGGFGQQGYGYNVRSLYGAIGDLLGVNEGYTAVILGLGNLGSALANSPMFARRGVRVLALFDVSPALVGGEIAGLPVRHIDTLEAFCAEKTVDFAVLTTPRPVACDLAARLAALGVRGIWNFADADVIAAAPGVIVENMHLSDSLMKLCYDLKNVAGEEEGKEET